MSAVDSNNEYSKIVPKPLDYILYSPSEKELLQQLPVNTTTKCEVRSTKKGVFHQILVTGAVLVLAAACGMPIGYSAILLPQLYNSSEALRIGVEMGSWIASVHSLATPVGSFVSGSIADRFGRRTTLLLSILPLMAGWCMLALSSSHVWILTGRVVAGLSVGLIGAPAQVLIAEIAEPYLRGILVGAPFVSYSMGILFVYALGSELHWRYVAWCGNILPILSGLALIFIPESPVWLIRNGKIDKAAKALTFLRGDEMFAKREMNMLIERFEQEKAMTRSTDNFFKLCVARTALKPLVIINAFNMLQILSGTFLVVFYAIDIISTFGENIDSMKAAVTTAVVRLICTIIFCFLLLTMRRRSMIVTSGIGSGISSIALWAFLMIRRGEPKSEIDVYFPAACIISYIAFNTGFMVMPGIMIGELLPAKIRGRVGGYIFALFNIVLFAVAKVFPMAHLALKTEGLFLLFGSASIIAAGVLYLILPETKGRTLCEIEDYFGQNNWLWLSKRKSSLPSDCALDDKFAQP